MPEAQNSRIVPGSASVALHPESPRVVVYPVAAFLDCIASSRKWAPKALEFKVSGNLIGHHDDETVTVLLVPTSIRTTYAEAGENPGVYVFEAPDYEVEGWLLGDYAEKIWIYGLIGCATADGSPDEVTLFRIKSGMELGVVPTSNDELYPSDGT